jgi:hypothetical protein
MRSVVTHVCPTWEYVYAADAQLLRLQRLQNRALRAIGNPDRCTPVPELHVLSKFLTCMTTYVTKLCRTKTELFLNHLNTNVRGIGQGEVRRRKYMRLKLCGSQAYDRSAD